MKTLILALIISIIIPAGIKHNDYKNCVRIKKSEFLKHQPYFNFIKTGHTVKHKGILRIKTTFKTIILKDDGEMQQYKYEGELTKTPIVLIHELEPNSEEYYLINKKTASIDTLVGKPIFNSNGTAVVRLEGIGTDMKQRIQIGQIINGRFQTKHLFTLKEDISPDHVYWFDGSTIFIKAENNYWRLNF